MPGGTVFQVGEPPPPILPTWTMGPRRGGWNGSRYDGSSVLSLSARAICPSAQGTSAGCSGPPVAAGSFPMRLSALAQLPGEWG